MTNSFVYRLFLLGFFIVSITASRVRPKRTGLEAAHFEKGKVAEGEV